MRFDRSRALPCHFWREVLSEFGNDKLLRDDQSTTDSSREGAAVSAFFVGAEQPPVQ
jgi:hypothetical protein